MNKIVILVQQGLVVGIVLYHLVLFRFLSRPGRLALTPFSTILTVFTLVDSHRSFVSAGLIALLCFRYEVQLSPFGTGIGIAVCIIGHVAPVPDFFLEGRRLPVFILPWLDAYRASVLFNPIHVFFTVIPGIRHNMFRQPSIL